MFDLEVRAYNYYTVIESRPKGQKIKDSLSSDLWIDYITCSNELTGNRVIPKKCVRCLNAAHAYLSDYFKK